MIYFTSDLHLGHKAIIHMQNRPFDSVDEMNEVLIDNINRIVMPNDKIYFLGDMAHHIPFEERDRLIKKIRCRNRYLIIGNHDLRGGDGEAGYDPALFIWMKQYTKESLSGNRIIMMHYPILSWDKMHGGSIMLHGHIHAGPEYNEKNIKDGIRRFDVGVDANDYKPVSIDTILSWSKAADEAHIT